jgi:hypothetical protein
LVPAAIDELAEAFRGGANGNLRGGRDDEASRPAAIRSRSCRRHPRPFGQRQFYLAVLTRHTFFCVTDIPPPVHNVERPEWGQTEQTSLRANVSASPQIADIADYDHGTRSKIIERCAAIRKMGRPGSSWLREVAANPPHGGKLAGNLSCLFWSRVCMVFGRGSGHPEVSVMTAIDPTDEFLRRVADCEQMAKFARDPASKATWKRMADRWLQCAERAKSPSVAAHRQMPAKRHPVPGWAHL